MTPEGFGRRADDAHHISESLNRLIDRMDLDRAERHRRDEQLDRMLILLEARTPMFEQMARTLAEQPRLNDERTDAAIEAVTKNVNDAVGRKLALWLAIGMAAGAAAGDTLGSLLKHLLTLTP